MAPPPTAAKPLPHPVGHFAQRMARRVALETSVQYQTPELLDAGESVNLSTTGMQLATGHAIKRGTAITVMFSLTHEERPFLATGAVAWCRTTRQSQRLPTRVGVRFDSAPEGIEHALERLAPTAVVSPAPSRAVQVADRRGTPRTERVARVRFRDREQFLEEYAANLSAEGLLIRSEDPPEPMSWLTIHLFAPGAPDRPIRLRGLVVHRIPPDPERGEIGGFGVHLRGSDPRQLERLHELAECLLERESDRLHRDGAKG